MTSKFFFTCLFFFIPTSVLIIASDGIDRVNWRCFAPKFLHLKMSVGIGTSSKVPLSKGEDVITFILCFLAKTNKASYSPPD